MDRRGGRRAKIMMAVLLLSISAASVAEAFSTQKDCRLAAANLKSSLHASLGEPDDQQHISSRRAALKKLFASSALVAGASLSTAANAYEKTFPDDLNFEDGDTSRDLAAIQKAKIAERNAMKARGMDYASSTTLFRGPKDVLSDVVWGGALWLLSGSRSNPLVTPLANIFYNASDEQWLKDRNEGLFAAPPATLYVVLGFIFLCLGVVTDRLILLLAEGDANLSLQLAGVSLIGGGALELGRIASGEKGVTREDFDRDEQLESEFAEFAEQRLKPGGNCHRSEVVAAFRRYYAKYRQADSTEYPLTDLEIERLVRNWARNAGAPMSSAGFFTGIQINNQADIFVQR